MPIFRVFQICIPLTYRIEPPKEKIPLRLKVVGPYTIVSASACYVLFGLEAIELLEFAALDIESPFLEIKVGDHNAGSSPMDGE